MPTNMTTDAKAVRDTDLDQELADVLIAISVITRQLAKKITANQTSKEGMSNEIQRNCHFIEDDCR